MRSGLKLVTFDGDGTIYPHGGVLDDDQQTVGIKSNALHLTEQLIQLLQDLLSNGISIALCTAFGSPTADSYERRLIGLLKQLKPDQLPPNVSVYAVGGHCNFVYKFHFDSGHFVLLPRSEWEIDSMRSWRPEQISSLLDAAEDALQRVASRLGLDPYKMIRKQFAVGFVYMGETSHSTKYALDEVALAVRGILQEFQIFRNCDVPFCTSNGGSDVFADIGTKELGIKVLCALEDAKASQVIHIGDQFTRTGNDIMARQACGTVSVDSPQETVSFLNLMLDEIDAQNSKTAGNK